MVTWIATSEALTTMAVVVQMDFAVLDMAPVINCALKIPFVNVILTVAKTNVATMKCQLEIFVNQ